MKLASHYLKHKINPVYALIIVVILSFISCQKEITGEVGSGSSNTGTSGTTETPAATTFKVKSYTEEVTQTNGTKRSETFNLTYDTKDRLMSMVSASNAGDKFVYTYNSDNTYTMDLFNANIISIHSRFFINSIGYVDSSFQYNDTKDSSTEKYIYNSAKQLVTFKEYDYSKASGSKLINTTNYTYDNNGNIIKETDISSTTTYQFYPDLYNNISMGLIYFQSLKNLIKTATYTSGSNTITSNHTYTFDNNKRMTTEKWTISTGEIVLKTYTYY